MASSSPGLTLAQYSFAKRVTAVSNLPSPAILGRAEPEIAAGPAMASPDDRTNTLSLPTPPMVTHAPALGVLYLKRNVCQLPKLANPRT